MALPPSPEPDPDANLAELEALHAELDAAAARLRALFDQRRR